MGIIATENDKEFNLVARLCKKGVHRNQKDARTVHAGKQRTQTNKRLCKVPGYHALSHHRMLL